MDYAKLLFAAEVRRQAAEIRNGARAQFHKESLLEGDEKQRAYDAWTAEHPVMSFVPQAVAQIAAVAEMIEPIQTPPEQ